MPAAAVVVLAQLAGVSVLAVTWLFIPGAGHFYVEDSLIGAAAGVAGGAAIAALYAALAVGRMGVVSPITAVIGASVPVVVGFALGERVGPGALIGVALAFLAVALVSANLEARSISLREPGIVLAVFSGLAIGALYVLLAGGHPDAVLSRLAIARGVSVVVLTAYALLRRESLRPAPKSMRIVLAAGALDMGANLLYVFAANSGMLAIVALITSLYPASTVFLARAFLNERLTRSQWFGVALAACGVVLIARFR
jgi:drug/metabolite transporter (DMT)-like permease